MTRFWGNHSGTRQIGGHRKVKPSTLEERLASMQRELANREQAYGPNHWLTTLQRVLIASEGKN